METFTQYKNLISNPDFPDQKVKAIQKLDYTHIDPPIVSLIKIWNNFSFCFTLQCCWGHFLYPGQSDSENLEPLPKSNTIDQVDYRMAYLAFCVENNEQGIHFLEAIREMVQIDPQTIQFGCADWFWNQQVNSYCLQVEPERFKTKDRMYLSYLEALNVEKVRNKFYQHLEKITKTLKGV